MTRRFLFIGAFLSLISNSSVMADEELDLSTYTGQVVVLDFWASWCKPCRQSFPWWNSMHAKYGDEGLVIIGVNLDNKMESAAEFLQEFPAEFRIFYDKNMRLAKSYGVQAMPSSYILDRSGKLYAKHFGFKVEDQEAFEKLLIEALKASK